MSEPDPSSESRPTPGERRLSRPPSDRYREAEVDAVAAGPEPDRSASVARGVALAVVVAAIGAASIVVLGGILTVTTGLVAVAGVMALGIGVALRWGAGTKLDPRRRVAIAIVLSVGAVIVAQVGLWQNARVEGGVLSPLEYLWDVFGPLVAIELGVAGFVAWLAAR